MKILPILQAPHKILTTKAKPIKRITPSLLQFIVDMKHTVKMKDYPKAVGLAAPQVGKAVQLFILHDKPNKPCQVFINPQLTLLKPQEGDAAPMVEGCLSIPNLWGTVARAARVRVVYLDEYYRPHDKVFSGYAAQIIQHEYDHLHGILFPQQIPCPEMSLYSYKEEENTFYSINHAVLTEFDK